ncbi:MAG: ABC transporter ATP-binding protein [Acetobacteraceae bacterium]
MSLLETESVRKSFGGIAAVDGVAFRVEAGALVGLIGPNGSGKTTLLNMLSGHLAPDAGKIRLDGKAIEGLRPDRLAHLGVLRMFQLTRVFRRMSARDNLLAAGRALGLAAPAARERASALLEELGLAEAAGLEAGQLSGGQQKLLEFGACFMVQPRIALLDEPFAAVHPTMKATMARFIRSRHANGQTFVVVSHDMPVVVELCPEAVCMSAGRIIASGTTRAVLNDDQVIEAYLGADADE